MQNTVQTIHTLLESLYTKFYTSLYNTKLYTNLQNLTTLYKTFNHLTTLYNTLHNFTHQPTQLDTTRHHIYTKTVLQTFQKQTTQHSTDIYTHFRTLFATRQNLTQSYETQDTLTKLVKTWQTCTQLYTTYTTLYKQTWQKLYTTQTNLQNFYKLYKTRHNSTQNYETLQDNTKTHIYTHLHIFTKKNKTTLYTTIHKSI